MLYDYKEENITLNCADGTPCIFEGYGSYCFTLNNKVFKFERVLYSSKMTRNLMSGIEAAKIGLKGQIDVNSNGEITLLIKDKMNKVIVK